MDVTGKAGRGGGRMRLHPLCRGAAVGRGLHGPHLATIPIPRNCRTSDPEVVTVLLPQSWQALGTCLSCNDEARQKAALLCDLKAAL